MRIISEKKGEEKMMSVYWFVMIVIIAGAVVAMVSMFYGNPYDVREVEANLMINKFSGCVSDSGKIDESFLNGSRLKSNVSLEENCGFDFSSSSTQVENERSEYYLEGGFYGFDSGESLENYSAGSRSFKAQCSTQNETQEYDRLVRCVNRSFYVGNSSSSAYEVNVLSVVSKSDENVN